MSLLVTIKSTRVVWGETDLDPIFTILSQIRSFIKGMII